MAFKKGQSGNPKGKPKGAKHKTTAMRTLVSDFLKNNWEDFEKVYSRLRARDKAILFERLLKYGLPTLQSVSIGEELEVQMKNMTDEQLQDLTRRIIEYSNSKHNG
jgi:hypothetical protein